MLNKSRYKSRVLLASEITQRFSRGEILDLYFRAGLDPDTLDRATGKESFAVQMVEQFERQGQIHKLIELLSSARPSVDWREIYDAASIPTFLPNVSFPTFLTLVLSFITSIGVGVIVFSSRPKMSPSFPAPMITVVMEATKTPVPSATSSLASTVRDEISNLVEGRLLFNPPSEMVVGESERVEVRLAEVLTITQNITGQLTLGLGGKGVPTIEPVLVGTFMKVALQGEKFSIVSLSSEGQLVMGNTPTQWSWDVTPNESGDLKLNLLVTVRIKMPGVSEETWDYPVKDKSVRVRANPIFSTTRFVSNNFNNLLSIAGLLGSLGFFGFVVKKFRDRRKVPVKMSSTNFADLRGKVEEYFSEDELKTICYDFRVDHEKFEDKGKGGLVRGLLLEIERQNKLEELTLKLESSRPNVRWREGSKS